MRQVETTGRTVEEAVGRAAGELGVDRDDVDVEVVDPGARGMLGLGAHEARVRVTLKGNPGAIAHTVMARLLQEMGLPGTVRVHQQDDVISVQVSGEGLGALIGRRGATLDAVQLLLGLMVARQTRAKTHLVVDVEGYRERRRVALEELAHRTAERVAGGGEVELEPMDASERRIIHTTLAGHPQVMTFSRGEGAARRVVVAPRQDAPPAEMVTSDE
ncbi:MAG: hypothetical protein AUI83_23675 [Armatimonadetes bacterium 13_1_40CM_3_65_7]|nr:MAG: hypothetical protein AUI83_23675 [Armatimonadetes bacterium 13_1_40CM_3_65_7]